MIDFKNDFNFPTTGAMYVSYSYFQQQSGDTEKCLVKLLKILPLTQFRAQTLNVLFSYKDLLDKNTWIHIKISQSF